MLKRRWGGGLLWEPGTGKTKTIIDWANITHMKGATDPDWKRLDRLLIVCPLSVVSVWADEIEEHSPLWDSGDLAYFEFDKNDEEIPYEKGILNVCIANYDIVWRRQEIFEDFKPQGVVGDESHRFKKPSGQRAMFMRDYDTVPYRAIMTGTATPRSWRDIYAQWRFLNKARYGTRVEDFDNEYLVYGGFMNKKVKGYRNVKRFRKKLRKDASTQRKDQCLDLPPEVYQRVPVILEDEAWTMYQRLAIEFFLELKQGNVDAKNAGVKILRLQQLTGGFLKTEEGEIVQVSTAKMKVLEDLLTDRLDEGRKVVIFCRFIPEYKAIERLVIRKFGAPIYGVRGGVKKADRDNARRQFQRSQEPCVFLAQVQSGGLGINLHSSHEAIFYSTTYALDDYVQARGRLHRSGQRFKVTYRHLVGVRTVDLDIYASLRAKQNVTDMYMGRPKAILDHLKGKAA